MSFFYFTKRNVPNVILSKLQKKCILLYPIVVVI